MKYTIITGATSGIGLELALVFGQNNHNLILVARNKDKLDELKEKLVILYKINVICFPMDISGEKNSLSFYEKVRKLNLKIDVLINNAGLGVHGKFLEKDFNLNMSMIDLNIVTPTVLTKLFLKDMVRNNSGKIFNIASTASFQSGPLMSVYYSTKSYLLGFSEGIAEEIRDTNVKIIAFCPGPTKTNFEKMKKVDLEKFKNFHIADPKDVAQYLYKNINTKKDVLIHGTLNKLLIFLTKFIPRKINLKIIKNIQQKK